MKHRSFSDTVAGLSHITTTQAHRRALRGLDVYFWIDAFRLCKDKNTQQQAANIFGLSLPVIELIETASEDKIPRLANTMQLSFALNVQDVQTDELLEAASFSIDPVEVYNNQECNDLMLAYWHHVSIFAQDNPVRAVGAFGVSEEVAQALSIATDAQCRYLAGTIEAKFTPRMGRVVMRNILQSDAPASIAHRLSAYQSGIDTEPKQAAPARREFAPLDYQQRHDRKTLGIYMLKAGYSRAITEIESGLGKKSVTAMAKEIYPLLEGGAPKGLQKRKAARSFVTSVRGWMDASILMLYYVSMSEHNDVYNQIDMVALENARGSFKEMSKELEALNVQCTSFTANEAWELANELRSNITYFTNCNTCGNKYLYGENIIFGRQCPYCVYAKSLCKAHSEDDNERTAS